MKHLMLHLLFAITLVPSMVSGVAAALPEPTLAPSKAFEPRTEFAMAEGIEVRAGAPYSLAAHKGKLVAVVFWSIDCQYCLKELPELQAFWKKHQSRGFELLGISVDDEAAPIRDYLTRYPTLTFPVLWRQSARVEDGFARIRGTPTTYVIGRDGSIIFKRFGQLRDEHYAELEKLIVQKQ